MSRLVLAAPCYRRYDLLAKMLESAERGSRKPDGYFVIDNGCKMHEQLASGAISVPDSTVVASTGRANGVAGAWNMAFAQNPDATILITNDDVEFHPGTIEALERAADGEGDFFFPSHSPGAMFCVFLLRRGAYDRIGPFDERFYPAYFEDNDYHRRMKLLGIREVLVDGASYDHVGSATLKSFDKHEQGKHNEEFKANQRRYKEKWGGYPGHETLEVPR